MEDRVRRRSRRLAWLAVALAAAVSLAMGAPAVGAADARGDHEVSHDNAYRERKLVSNLPNVGQLQDPKVKNAWGIAFGPSSPVWIADNGSDSATVYTGAVRGSPVVKVPIEVNVTGGSPTGQVFNPTKRFVVSANGKSDAAKFIFASENGDITGWSPNVDGSNTAPGTHVDGAVYKGLAIGVDDGGPRLFAANFHAGTVDVFDGSFKPVKHRGAFVDDDIPPGYAPFNVAIIDDHVVVTYALQNAEKHDDVAGPGHGFVDVFTSEGHLVRRFASRGVLDSPWGVVVAPKSFGGFGGKLLIGNFGDGRINAFDWRTGARLGTLRDDRHRPIVIDGLWALALGNGTFGDRNSLVFTAGPDHESNGLIGTLSPVDS